MVIVWHKLSINLVALLPEDKLIEENNRLLELRA
jgi:hypothetical protein